MYKPCTAVLLPTKDKSQLCLWNDGKLYTAEQAGVTHFNHVPDSDNQTMCLYIISDDEIQKGDYLFDQDVSELFGPYEEGDFIIGNHKKVIASTDLSLSLPQISEEDLVIYCETQLKEVLVDYTYGFPHLSSDNFISIKWEERTYTKEEVEILLKKAFKKGENWGITYSTWFIPTKKEQKEELNKCVDFLL